MQPVLAEVMWIPVNRRDSILLKKQFTVDYWSMGTEGTVPVSAYIESEDGRWLGVPRQEGLKLVSNYDDQRVCGQSVRFPKLPRLRPYQVPFAEAMLQAARGEYPDFMAYAATGKGKTVVALHCIGTLSVTAIAIVDQEKLMEQWIERAQEYLGLDVGLSVGDILKGRGRDIGIARGALCNFEGKKLVIGMVQSLSQRRYPEEFYIYFGVAVFDEFHTLGAPVYSSVLMTFPAKVRFGVSATPNRRDALKKLLQWNLGDIEATLVDRHQKSRVYYLESEACPSWYANSAVKSGRYLTELAEDPQRNFLIATAIKWLFDQERDSLIIGDRIEQLCDLMALCRAMGIPEEQMGLYARYRAEWCYEKDPTPPRRPAGWEKNTDYTPVRFGVVMKRMKAAELQHTFDNARLIFATRKMFSKGVDAPRLCGGVDATPTAQAVQTHGRILRPAIGKKTPIWITIRDVWSYRAENQFLSRLKEYKISNAEVYLWKPDKGIVREDVVSLAADVRDRIAHLKAGRIITRLDGSYTVMMPNTLPAPAVRPATTTARRTPSLQAS